MRKTSPENGGVMCCFAGENVDLGLVSFLTFSVLSGADHAESPHHTIEPTVGPAAVSTGDVEQLDNGSLRLNAGAQINLGNSAELNPTTAMTVCMWLSLLQDHPGAWHLLATKWNDEGATNDKYFFSLNLQDTRLNLLMSEDGETFGTVAAGGSMLTENGVTHVCFTAEAGGAVLLFVDGVPVGQPGTYAASTFPQISQPLMLGCKANGDESCGDFVVDEFQMWGRALSATEIYRAVFLDSYNPGWGALSTDTAQEKCEWDVFYQRAQQVTAKCCGDDGNACDEEGLPASCGVDCGSIFVPFFEECQQLLVELLEEEVTAFDAVETLCLDQQAANLYRYMNDLETQGCVFPARDDLEQLNEEHLCLNHFDLVENWDCGGNDIETVMVSTQPLMRSE